MKHSEFYETGKGKMRDELDIRQEIQRKGQDAEVMNYKTGKLDVYQDGRYVGSTASGIEADKWMQKHWSRQKR